MASLLKLVFTLFLIYQVHAQQWHQLRSSHQPKKLDASNLQRVASLSNMQAFDVTVDPILVPRVVGTPNHAKVKQYIIDQMKSFGWDIETDKFSDNTPLGRKEFENIIATLDPNARRRLVLACHYDSKFSKDDAFIGATDSAVPCAMMITLARDLAPQLDALKKRGEDLTLQYIFFDGEEAFRTWNSRDSIYGARHLAKKWQSLTYPPNTRERTNHLNRMDIMVLLDLLGAPKPQFFNYIQSGSRSFQHMVDIEQRMRQLNLLSMPEPYFNTQFSFGGIEDDHIPFMQRNVPILHMITSPFPDVWHTNADNKSALHYPTIDDLNKILRTFVCEYLGLQF